MTFFFTIAYLDKYLRRCDVHRSKMQLFSCVALLLATKINEVSHLLIEDLVRVSADIYTSEDFVKAEMAMFRVLNFNLYIQTEYGTHCTEMDNETLKKLYRMTTRFICGSYLWTDFIKPEFQAPELDCAAYRQVCNVIDT